VRTPSALNRAEATDLSIHLFIRVAADRCDSSLLLADCAPVLYSTLDIVRTSPVLFRQANAVGDDSASLRVYVIVVMLIVIGLLLVGLAVWLFRQTRPEPELLAPLERMNARSWRRLDPQGRRRALDEVRPDGAFPIDHPWREPPVDQEFATTRPVRDFSDLADAQPLDTAILRVDELVVEVPVAEPAVEQAPVEEPVVAEPAVDVEAVVEPVVEPSSAIAAPQVDAAGPIIASSRTRRSGGRSSTNGDDTGEHASEAAIDIPLMPGEGLLRRPRSDADSG
jgi:hypothetical protein